MGNRPHTRIENLFDLRYFLAKLINKVQRDEIGVEKAKCLASVSRVLLETLTKEKEEVLEKRIEELERLAGIENTP